MKNKKLNRRKELKAAYEKGYLEGLTQGRAEFVPNVGVVSTGTPSESLLGEQSGGTFRGEFPIKEKLACVFVKNIHIGQKPKGS